MTGRSAVVFVTLALSCPPAAVAAGDPGRGEALHQSCLGCHGTEVYVPPLATARTAAALRREVVKWNDRMNPKFTRQEIDDVTAYLNRDFYRLPK